MKDTLGGRILDLLNKKNMTQRELAERICVTESVLSRYISGDREPKPNMIANIATALHTTSDYLLGLETDNDFSKACRIIARNSSKMTREQKQELIMALLGED